MQSLMEQLGGLQGRICLMCVGNSEGGDDALGVRLGEQLAGPGMPQVIIAGNEPERFLLRGISDAYDHLIFIDAVDVGAAPGSVVFLSAEEMTGRLPQMSTHRLSLGLLARWVQARGATRVWLLGVQPQSLQRRGELSPSVRTTLAALGELLQRRFNAGAGVC